MTKPKPFIRIWLCWDSNENIIIWIFSGMINLEGMLRFQNIALFQWINLCFVWSLMRHLWLPVKLVPAFMRLGLRHKRNESHIIYMKRHKYDIIQGQMYWKVVVDNSFINWALLTCLCPSTFTNLSLISAGQRNLPPCSLLPWLHSVWGSVLPDDVEAIQLLALHHHHHHNW